MKKPLLFLICLIVTSVNTKATVHTITNSGLSFSPTNLTIMDGDTVRFVLNNSHDAKEVTQSTWQSGGNAGLSGGFQTPFGGGFVYPDKLTPGIHYYVCTPHAAAGMKGTIEVIGSTGLEVVNSKNGIRVFPNPATDYITIESPLNLAGVKFGICNSSGMSVLFGVFSGGRQTLSVAALPKGYYILIPACDIRMADFIKQ